MLIGSIIGAIIGIVIATIVSGLIIWLVGKLGLGPVAIAVVTWLLGFALSAVVSVQGTERNRAVDRLVTEK